MLAGDSLPREIDIEALSDYFSLGYIPAPKTIYRAANKLLPGHYLVASAKDVRVQRYWDISFAEVEQRTRRGMVRNPTSPTLRSHSRTPDERGAAWRVPERRRGFVLNRRHDGENHEATGHHLLNRLRRARIQ